MKRSALVCLLCMFVLARTSTATVYVLPSTMTNTSYTVTPPSGGSTKWSVVCTSTNNATSVDWYVWSDATNEVADITINNQASSQCRLFIGIDGNTGHPVAPFGSIDTLTRNSGSGPVVLMDVRTSTTGSHSGNVDRIKVHSINAGNIAGSVSTLFVVESNTGIGENSIESLRVRGNIECDISMPRGSIYGLTVDGSIDLAGSHVAVDVSHHITSLQA